MLACMSDCAVAPGSSLQGTMHKVHLKESCWTGRLAWRASSQGRLRKLRARRADDGSTRQQAPPLPQARGSERTQPVQAVEPEDKTIYASKVTSVRDVVEGLWLAAQYIVFMHRRYPIIATFTVPFACLAGVGVWALVAITLAILRH